MKIAITGDTAGIGQALAQVYQSQGHEIVGLSKRNGHNIRNIPKIITHIEPCDMFVNNAQAGFAQTELLFEMYRLWKGQPGKCIINISTMMTTEPISSLPGIDMIAYRNQKIALEEAHCQLRHLQDWPKLVLIRPGAVATQPGQTSPVPYANVDRWAQVVVCILNTANPDLEVSELSLGVNYT
jgi:NAD(P)-dependent dehydrogenase (short-subunit alcohol dehydrogenase family)|tara:strand:- start:1685 stop:2233 length:549 start_codon:yes stop_codon:yes gene_type:complete